MALQKETVAIPFSAGIQPSTRARLLEPQKLITAQNCFFVQDQGPQKRFGHAQHSVRTSASYVGLGSITPPVAPPARETFSPADPQLPASWLYGWGIYSSAHTDTAATFTVSPQPDVGLLFGETVRDNEVISWDGHRLFSFAPEQPSKFGEMQSGTSATSARTSSCMPMLRAQTLAKIADSQRFPDAADNGVLRVIAWVNSDNLTISYSAYDSLNRSCLVSNASLTFQSTPMMRCISVGNWFHILVADNIANSLEMRSFNQENPTTIISRSLGTVNKVFDIKKIDETRFIVIRSKAGVISATLCNSDGTTITTFTPALGGFAASDNFALACEVDFNKNVGIAWQTSGAPHLVNFASYSLGGTVITARQQVDTITVNGRMTLNCRVVKANATSTIWDIFVEDTVASVPQTKSYAVIPGTSSTLIVTRHRVLIASHAVRVGNRTFVWLVSWLGSSGIGLQNTWFLCDSALLPVGKMDYGSANINASSTNFSLAGINWTSSAPFKDRIVFHGALPYNQRLPVQTAGLTTDAGVSATPTSAFTESSVHYYELDFLPTLRAAQAGRCAYFAGAQLWACDGAENVEATFHMAPEGVSGTAAGSGGSLSAGTYRYRVDLCHKNLQNEEVRSWSIITSGIVAVNNDKITLTIPVMPMTRREDAYFLIFRTAANGSVYYLANSRDPLSASFLRNNQANASFTYQDTLSDATLQLQEYYPGNTGGLYVDPLPAPASEIVAGGRDRLWLAGGELAPGEVAPSRLFFPGQTPAYSPALNIQVDRNAEPITAIGFVGDITAIFRRTSIYILDSDGPDNSFNGSWASPRLSSADTGAIGQESLVLSVVGLWFQSPAGIRRLNNGGGMDLRAGGDMDPVAQNIKFAAAISVPQFTQLRWYSRDSSQPTLVYNYSTDAWCTWTGVTCIGGAYWPNSNLAIISRADGKLWVETEGLFMDGGSVYEMITRTAWLHSGQLGDFQRVRRFVLFGKLTLVDDVTNIKTRIYYDERPFFDEEITRQIDLTPSVQSIYNTSTWGSGSWGSVGAWGDDANISEQLGSELWFRDGVFRMRIRPHRQKCSVISIEFSDNSAQASNFEPVVLALEIGKKSGLDRVAAPVSA